MEAKNYGGGVVPPIFLNCSKDNPFGRGTVIPGFLLEGHAPEGTVGKAFDHAVGTEDISVPRFSGEAGSLGLEELSFASEDLLEGGASGMAPGLVFGNFSFGVEPADVVVILCEGFKVVFVGVAVDPAVPDMAVMETFRLEQAKAQGRTHSTAFGVSSGLFEDFVVDLVKKLLKEILAGFVFSWKILVGGVAGEGFHGDPAGEFAGIGSAHAVTDSKDEAIPHDGGVAIFPKAVDLSAFDEQGKEGVFIIFAESAYVREGAPVDFFRAGHWEGLLGVLESI